MMFGNPTCSVCGKTYNIVKDLDHTLKCKERFMQELKDKLPSGVIKYPQKINDNVYTYYAESMIQTCFRSALNGEKNVALVKHDMAVSMFKDTTGDNRITIIIDMPKDTSALPDYNQ